MTGTHHSLTIVDRSAADHITHRHPYRPECACGWSGIPRRRRSGAEQQYHQHLANKVRSAADNGMPRALTSTDRLPDTLR